MGEPLSATAAALVVASLCMPPTIAQHTGYILLQDEVTIQPAHNYKLAGVLTTIPPIIEATVLYWAGTDTRARFIRFEGRKDQLLGRINARLPKLPGCVPVG